MILSFRFIISFIHSNIALKKAKIRKITETGNNPISKTEMGAYITNY